MEDEVAALVSHNFLVTVLILTSRSLTMVPVCVRPVSPEMMLPELSSRMSCDQHNLMSTNDSSIVGRPRHQGVMVGMGQKDSYVG